MKKLFTTRTIAAIALLVSITAVDGIYMTGDPVARIDGFGKRMIVYVLAAFAVGIWLYISERKVDNSGHE